MALSLLTSADKQGLTQIDEKGYVSDEVRNSIFRRLRMKNENRVCFECSARNPTWISISYGTYLCLECSGDHRRMGTHLSFVRSIELDKFNPEQLVQMSCGGNASAWTYFKQHGMGKTSDGGRRVEYAGKAAARYKQQLQKQTVVACEQLAIVSKPSPPVTTDSTLDKMSAPKPTNPDEAPTVFEQPVIVSSQSAPAVITPPKEPVATVAELVVEKKSKPSPLLRPQPRPQPGRVKAAKQIDFDFDFDELENEANKPKPAPTPAPVPIKTPQPTAKQDSIMSSYGSRMAETRAQNSNTEHQSKFSSAKAISSDDFFGDQTDSADTISFSDQIQRENRYLQFSGATAISSDNFFNDGPIDSKEGESDWRGVAERGVDLAKAGLFKGKDLLTTYLAKARD